MTTTELLKSEIFENIPDKSLAVFCGAGVSYNSGMPLVGGKYGLIASILSHLPLDNELQSKIMKVSIPFELIIETITKGVSFEYRKGLYNLFDNRLYGLKPSNQHDYIIELALNGIISTICTTNFDTLFEQSLENRIAKGDVPEDFRYAVYHSNAKGNTHSFHNIDWRKDELRIIKIHGCVSNPKELGITISHIARRENSLGKMNIIQKLFGKEGTQHYSVIVMGYSCSDHFDITPYLKNIKTSDKKVVFINHAYDDQVLKEELIHIKNVREYPLDEYSNHKQEDINPFKNVHTDSIWINVNTDRLIGSKAERQESDWPKLLEQWFQSIAVKYVNEFLHSISFKLLEKAHLFKEAVLYLQRLQPSLQDEYSNPSLLLDMGWMLENQGKLTDSRKWFKKAESLISVLSNPDFERYCYEGLSSNLRRLGHYEESITYSNKALQLNQKFQDEEGIAQNYVDIGLCLYNMGQ